ncbi:MAG: hypothetical protein V4557_12890 [Bacteroidota bacterium]
MNEKNIESLKARMVTLGFEPAVESCIRCNACFMVSSFELSMPKRIGNDRYHFSVHVERNEKEMYDARYYAAVLRKEIIVPAGLLSLDLSMGAIDWGIIADGKFRVMDISAASILKVADVLQQLNLLGPDADLLKFKYWSGTSLESSIEHLAVLKSEWEIAERFYLFDDGQVISFADAIRYLNSKWMEKQFVVKRKLLVKRERTDKTSAGAPVGKLLTKNPRRNSRRVDKT